MLNTTFTGLSLIIQMVTLVDLTFPALSSRIATDRITRTEVYTDDYDSANPTSGLVEDLDDDADGIPGL